MTKPEWNCFVRNGTDSESPRHSDFGFHLSLGISSFVIPASFLCFFACFSNTALSSEAPPAIAPVGDNFTIGVYYSMPSVSKQDTFGWEYAFMDMARHGVTFIVTSGNTYANQWSAIKRWGMKGVTAYGELNAYHGPGQWSREKMLPGIEEIRGLRDGYVWNGEYVGDAVLGHVMVDEPECSGKTEDQQDFLRAWADTYHDLNPTRSAYVNHCDPPWFDLHQKVFSCSVGATICVNGHRIVERVNEAKKLGGDGMDLVALSGSLGGWIAPKCENVNYYGFGPCSEEVQEWLKDRNIYQDVYEELIAAYAFGADGYRVFLYNFASGYAVAMVETNGIGKADGRWDAFGDAADDVRRSQAWPGVKLLMDGKPFEDRGAYPAGEFRLTAQAVSDSGMIAQVMFGKSTNGGSDWKSIEDDTAPYEATFPAGAGETIIFRAQAKDTDGKKSIYAANMIYVD
jgi:hypothetical protein